MRRPLLAATLLALSLAPALALHGEPDHDDVLVPYLKQGYREGQSLSGNDAHLGMVQAVVLDEGEGVARHRSVVFVFANSGHARRLIHQAEYAWARLDRLADIDGDGRLDLAVRAGNGGNCWGCEWVEAVTLTADRALPLIPPERFQRLEDVDGDGVLEAIAVDTRWEFFEGMCHACSPSVDRVYRRRGADWIDASASFPQHYRRTADALVRQLEAQSKESPDFDENQFGALASILLNRLVIGEADAWKAFDARIAEWRAALEKSDPDGLARLDALVTALKKQAR